MFFGYDKKPEFINVLINRHGLKPQRTKMNVCTRNKGIMCGGSVPFTDECGNTVWKYRYFVATLPEDRELSQEEYSKLWNDENNWVYDDGIDIYKYTITFKGNEYSWYDD